MAIPGFPTVQRFSGRRFDGHGLRVRVALAAALLFFGQIAPVVHAAHTHPAGESSQTEMSADCSLCELTAARTTEICVESDPSTVAAPIGALTARMPVDSQRVDGPRSRPSEPRAPPVFV